MEKQTSKATPASTDPKDLESLDKIRWSLRQRLCEHMRRLNTELFDELDDFLFYSVQPEELAEGSAQLKLIREFRNKKQLFEEKFLGSIDAALQSTLISGIGGQPVSSQAAGDETGSSAYQKMEVDLALERMQRKAFKHYAARIQQLGDSGAVEQKPDADAVIPEKRDILIKNTLRALADSHRVFRVSLESRLVFLKLFEKHFLLKMDRLYQDVISIINNKDNRKFVERLYSSSTNIYKRRSAGKSDSRSTVTKSAEEDPQLSVSNRIAAKVDKIIEHWNEEQALPEFVATMLRDDWHSVLFLMGLNKGAETREWCEAKRTIDSLLSLLSADTGSGSDAVELAKVQERLEQGFDLIHKESEEQQAFLTSLKEYLDTRAEKSSDTTSLIEVPTTGITAAKGSAAVSNYAAVSEAGRKILNNSDLDDFIALLSDEQEQAIAEVEEEAISMDYYLNMVDAMADGATAELKYDAGAGKCRVQKSSSVANSYQILDEKGRVLLTRGRLGLAVSLRAGEIRLEGQEDFNSGQAVSRFSQPGNASELRPHTTH